MTQTQKTWHILGAGAIGCLWAIRLQKAGIPIRLMLSPRRLRTLKGRSTLELEYLRSPALPSSEKISLAVAEAKEKPRNLLLATKANDALGALQSNMEILDDCQNLITLCNGMGYHDAVQKLLPASRLFAISTTDGAYFQSGNRLVMAGKGTNKIARIVCDTKQQRRALKSLAMELSTRGHPLQPRINADRMLMDKLLINACINGLTGIYDCPNGGLLSSKEIREELKQLIEECQSIAVVCGFTRLANQLPERVRNVINVTASNYSSTCMDIKLGRKTEINYINAYLCGIAAEHDQTAPANEKIVSAIHRLETASQLP